MDLPLDPIEVRILGSLLEKEITTPDYYPLTLNALLNACNQKSNRDPIAAYDEDTVAEGLERLRQKRLVSTLTGAGIRVPKHRELLAEALNLGRRELALLSVLMLRGPQTLGELRGRTETMHPFSDLAEVESCLQRLMEQEPALAARLPRRPGTKEPRYAHLLSGEVAAEAEPRDGGHPAPLPPPGDERLAALEAEVAALGREVQALKRELLEFRKQFE